MLTVIAMIHRLLLFCWLVSAATALAAAESLFDGKTLNGWEGETNSVWRVREGAIVGGSLTGNARNEFLATRKSYRNFRLRLEYRLVGTEGFVNGGVQFRSRRIANPPNEMSGYQADIGAGYSGCLYDESRRKIVLATADTNLVTRIEKPGDWNRYEIVVQGVEIQLFLNGQRTVAWVEREPGIDREGVIALQIHGGNKAEVSYRNIELEELAEPTVPSETEALLRIGDRKPVLPLPAFSGGEFQVLENEVVVFVGQENFVREEKAGALEALLASGYAERKPRFRSMAWEADTVYEQWRDLNFGSWTAQMETAGATMVIAQFGQMEALDGPARLPEFTAAYHRLLDQFAVRTRRFVLVSPMPFEKPLASHAPDLTKRNGDVAIYAEAVRQIAKERGAVFIDLFRLAAPRLGSARRTDDGIHLTSEGLQEIAGIIASELNGKPVTSTGLEALREAIIAKNRLWFDCWRPANWSFVYGDRVTQEFPKGANGQPALKQVFEELQPAVRRADAGIQRLALGENVLAAQTGRRPVPDESKALSPEEQLATFTVADGFAVNLFASERNGVVKPTQIAWDERGRLYVACSPTYPQSRASDSPGDFILALEDTDHDGVADKSWRFAEGLTMVQGLEATKDGLLVCDFDQIVRLCDTNGDGKADERSVLFSGFGIGDTHQLVNSISYGPDGSLWFTQGLHAFSRVETPWGIARLDRAGVWRLRPRELRLEGFFGGGMAGANCWGVAFDDYGQVFHKSGDRPQGYWTVPGIVRGASPLGSGSATSADTSYANSPEQYHSVGALFDTSPKTTSIEIIGTRGLPDEIQGCAVIAGYFGAVIELHRFADAGSGFKTTQLPKLLKSSDTAFRPVDVSVGPDGAIYAADWYNPVIGHYQASYADPRRDKSHGRIWRISSRKNPLIRQPNLATMEAAELLEQLRSPERWTRAQAKRLLFEMPDAKALPVADRWVERLQTNSPDYERLLLEVTGIFEAHEAPRPALLGKLLSAKDARVRAYGARVAGNWGEQLTGSFNLLSKAARDENPRVRLEAAVAASYIPAANAIQIVTATLESPVDPFLNYAIRASARALQPRWAEPFRSGKLAMATPKEAEYLRGLLENVPRKTSGGEALYEMACLPCHQPEGKGLTGVYPALVESERLRRDPAEVIKIVLHGLTGQNVVGGQTFGGANAIAMPSLGGLSDEQISEVLTYVRQQFGAGASEVSAEKVQAVRAASAARSKPWTVEELAP